MLSIIIEMLSVIIEMLSIIIKMLSITICKVKNVLYFTYYENCSLLKFNLNCYR